MNLLIPAIPVVAFGATVAHMCLTPSSNLLVNVVTHGPRDSSKVAMTFDDGPSAGPSEKVLAILARQNVKATFFVIGRNVRDAPDLLRRMHAEGHEIGNHSYDHWHWGFVRRKTYWRDQIRRTDDEIENVIGVRPTIYRPPFGVRTPRIAAAIRAEKKKVIMWSVRTVDANAASADSIVRRCKNVRGGDIILLHDGVDPDRPKRDPAATLAALPTILNLLAKRRLQLETTSTLVTS